MRAIFVVFAALCLAACAVSESEWKMERLDHIEQVILRQPGYYTIVVQNPETAVVELRPLRLRTDRLKIVADVPSDQKAYLLTWRATYNGDERAIYRGELHIQSAKDLGVGGYMVPNGKSQYPVQPMKLLQ